MQMRDKAKRNGIVGAYIQTLLVLVTEGYPSIDFDTDSGFVIQLFMVGEIALLKKGNTYPLTWRKARVTETFPRV